jgi:hypothetical protein
MLEKETCILLIKELANLNDRIDMVIDFCHSEESQPIDRNMASGLAWIREAAVNLRDFLEQNAGIQFEDEKVIDPDVGPNSDFLILNLKQNREPLIVNHATRK